MITSTSHPTQRAANLTTRAISLVRLVQYSGLRPSSPDLTVSLSLDHAGKQPRSTSAERDAKHAHAPSNNTPEQDENVPPSVDADHAPPSTSQVPQPPTIDRLHERNLANAQGLRRIRTWKTLVSRILNLFPHPNVDKRPHSSWPQSHVSERRQYVTLMLVRHSLLSSSICNMIN